MDWKSYLVVGIGGGLGAIARFSIGSWIVRQLGSQFPWGTFAVNISGSFCIGLAMALLTETFQPHPYWRLFLVVGFLGGYTTFSSLEYETLQAISTGGRLTGVSYMLGSLTVGYAAVLIGTIVAGRR